MTKHRMMNAERHTHQTDYLLQAAAIAAQAAEDAQAESGRRTPTQTRKHLQRLADACAEITKLRRKQKGKR